MNITLIIVLIISYIVGLIFSYIFLRNESTKIEVFEFSGKDKGDEILIGGSIHGNEPAGSDALLELIDEIKSGKITIKSGKLTIVPTMNPLGKKFGIRVIPYRLLFPGLFFSDGNRTYGWYDSYVSDKMKKLASGKSLVVDLHEGYDYAIKNSSSIGSGAYPGPANFDSIKKLCENAVKKLNENITDDNKKFVARLDKDEIYGTLGWWCAQNKIPFILLETTKYGQALEIRKNQHLMFIKDILKDLNIITY
jgi:hypothetical protein